MYVSIHSPWRRTLTRSSLLWTDLRPYPQEILEGLGLLLTCKSIIAFWSLLFQTIISQSCEITEEVTNSSVLWHSSNLRHPLSVDDIDEVIKRAEHYRFEEEEPKVFLNPISALPTSKRRLKKSIIERINFLIAGYSSLATFVPDETIEYVSKNPQSEKTKRIYLKMLADIEKLKREVMKKIHDHATNP